VIWIVAAVAGLISGLGFYALVSPPGLMRLVARMNSNAGLWTAAVLRVLFGIALWTAAPASRVPLALEVLAVITVIAGLALPIIGLARLGPLIEWWSQRPAGLIRGWACLVIAFGGFLVWAAVP